jgi:PiT family inorganic phosphate transporter
MGLAASFGLGANDVSNAVGIWTAVHVGTAAVAGLAGGLAMGIGALTWGRRILDRVAFDIVTMDRVMATAAQGVQAMVVLLAVTQGLFTSMNQALVGAMAGAGIARGRQTVKRAVLAGILKGWADQSDHRLFPMLRPREAADGDGRRLGHRGARLPRL